MTRRKLSDAEARVYREGGFRLEGSPRTADEAERDRLDAARRLLRLWGANAAAARATLAAPSASTLTRWQKGEHPIPQQTHERVAVIMALYHRCFRVDNGADVAPLPPLRRPGRRTLPAGELLAAGKLSDLLGLWRQMQIAEERIARFAPTTVRRRRRTRSKIRRHDR